MKESSGTRSRKMALASELANIPRILIKKRIGEWVECWTATDLLKMPARKRNEIWKAAAEYAAEDYRNDPELTAFEAFGKDDLYGESSSSEAGVTSASSIRET